MDQQYEDKMPPRRRSINVIDVDNLDKRLSFQTGPKLLLGRYEDWTTQPICTKGGSMFGSGSITLDVTSPITGVKSVTELDVPVQLGYYQDGHFMRSTAQRRVLTIKDMKIGDENCMFDVGSIHGSRTPLGYFYTDAYGKELMDGPGRQSVRQFLKPGFSISLNGKYEALDSWLQMYEKDHLSVVKNIGFGLDPNEN